MAVIADGTSPFPRPTQVRVSLNSFPSWLNPRDAPPGYHPCVSRIACLSPPGDRTKRPIPPALQKWVCGDPSALCTRFSQYSLVAESECRRNHVARLDSLQVAASGILDSIGGSYPKGFLVLYRKVVVSDLVPPRLHRLKFSA